MEKQPESHNRVPVTRVVYDGLETIRLSGATNMLDRPVVLRLAREWNLPETAEWIERVDTGTYGRLILIGPEIIEEETLDEKLDRYDREYDEERRGFWEGIESSAAKPLKEEPLSHITTPDRPTMQTTLVQLGHLAAITLADTYDTEEMGVLFGSSLERLTAERTNLLRNLTEAANLAAQLEETLNAIEQGIASLQSLIDPENN